MRNYIYIGIGGFLGAISRYLLTHIQIITYTGGLPVNTLIINITGSFVLALVLTLTLERWKVNEAVRLGITTGFLGAYTTFSTLCKELVQLLQSGSYPAAVAYLVLSVLFGLLAVSLGILVANGIAKKSVNRTRKNPV